MAAVPIPVRATVRDVLRDLLGTPVVVREGEEQQLTEDRTAYLAVFRRDDGTPVAATIVDLAGAAAMGGARSGTSAADVATALQGSSALEGGLHDSFTEVVDGLTGLLNSPMTEHVRLDGVLAVPGQVPQRVADVVLAPTARIDYAIEIEGHDRGTFTLVCR